MEKRMHMVIVTTSAARDVTYWTVKLQQNQEEIRNEFFGVGPML